MHKSVVLLGVFVLSVFISYVCFAQIQLGPTTWESGTVNIGLGLTNPTQPLEVKGTVKADSFIGDGSQLTNMPIETVYDGSTVRTNVIKVYKTGTVGSGIITFYLTTDNTSNGPAIFPNGIIDGSINLFVSDATASYQMSYALTNSNKTLTVTANKLTTANILTGLLGQAQANGAVVRLTIWGY